MFSPTRLTSLTVVAIPTGVLRCREYLQAESQDKRKTDFDFDGWENITDPVVPQQVGPYDCGVFACQFMNYASQGREFTFRQKHMPYLRNRMTYELVKAELLA